MGQLFLFIDTQGMQAPIKKGSNTKYSGKGNKSPAKPRPRTGSCFGSQYYEDMTIKYLGKLEDGKKSGMGKEFHQNGNLYYEGNYQNNEPHGEQVTLWHPNKQTMYTGGMIEGKKNGQGTEFYENGQILFNGTWSANEPYGTGIQIFNEDGSVMFEGDKERVMPDEGGVEVVSETTTTQVTADGTEVTKTTVTTETLGEDTKNHEETVQVTETVQTVTTDADGNVVEVE